MTDKVQKIRDFLDGMANEDCVSTIVRKAIEEKMLPFIDSLQEDPVSEDLEEAAVSYAATGEILDNGKEMIDFQKEKSFKAGAQWQKEQIMKDCVICGGDGWFINGKRNCRKNGKFHKYFQSTITHDKPLMMDSGKKYKLIIIKGE